MLAVLMKKSNDQRISSPQLIQQMKHVLRDVNLASLIISYVPYIYQIYWYAKALNIDVKEWPYSIERLCSVPWTVDYYWFEYDQKIVVDPDIAEDFMRCWMVAYGEHVTKHDAVELLKDCKEVVINSRLPERNVIKLGLMFIGTKWFKEVYKPYTTGKRLFK